MPSLPLLLTGLFFVAILAIAAWGMKKTQNVNDFLLGGGVLGPWILAISYGAAYFSAVVFIGFAGQYGWVSSYKALWVGVANAVFGGLVAWLVLGRRTRSMTRRLNASTTPEFFATRYGSNGMKIAGAVVIFLFMLPYSASVFAGLTYLFTEVFNISLFTALTVVVATTGLYIVFGGYKAAARIDFLQGIVMFVGATAMVWFVANRFAQEFGGYGAAFAKASELYRLRLEGAAGELQVAPVDPISPLVFWSVVFMTSIAPWGLPQMVHKYYAIKDEGQIVKGAVVCCVFALLVGCAAYLTGALSHLLPPEILEKTLTNGAIDPNKLVPTMLVECLPQWFLAIILLLVLSASMSTLCSLALVSSAAVGVDLVKGFIAPNASEKTHLTIFRVCCAVFILASYFIALFNPSWIVALMSLSWGAVAGAFLAPYMYGLFWRRTTKAGAIAGMVAGLVVANGFYWGLFVLEGPGAAKKFSPLVATVAMLVPFVVVPLVSLATKPLSPERVAKAFGDEASEAQTDATV